MSSDIDNIVSTQSGPPAKSGEWIEHAAKLPIRFDYERTRSVDIDMTALEKNFILPSVEPGDFSNSYKIIRSQILHKMRDNGWKTLGITSPGKCEGKTLTAINLAISIALEVNYTVLLVDADMRKPEIAGKFGFESDRGLAECLSENVPIEDLLIHPNGFDRFVLLPGGKSIVNASETLSSHMMIDFITEVKSRYPSRIVVFDLPPVLVAGESLSIAPYMDSMLLIVEAGTTRKEDIVRSRELLAKANLLGTVLSKT